MGTPPFVVGFGKVIKKQNRNLQSVYPNGSFHQGNRKERNCNFLFQKENKQAQDSDRTKGRAHTGVSQYLSAPGSSHMLTF